MTVPEVVRSERIPSTDHIIRVVRGDILLEKVDAVVRIVPKTNVPDFTGILHKAGQAVEDECTAYVLKHGEVEAGHILVTGPGKLSHLKKILHCVGSSWKDGLEDEDVDLQVSVRRILETSDSFGLQVISIPAVPGYKPKEKCAAIMLDVTRDFCSENPNSALREIRFTNPDKDTVDAYTDEFDQCFGLQTE